MTQTQADASLATKEQRALAVSKWGNFFMGLAGVAAAWASHSQALLVDGLFSMVGFTSAIFAARVSKSIGLLPDDRRPLGYAADESIYTTFRSLSLLGLLVFAFCAAVLNIVDYASGGDVPQLNYEPIVIYLIVICIACFGLAANHHFAWKSTGQQSDMLRLEKKAAIFDGIMTVTAGAGLSATYYLAGGPLGWITPIGDSLIVLLLCGFVAGRYYSDFMKGIAELAGTSIAEDQVQKARRAVQIIVDETDGRLVDLSVVRFGRTFQVQVYFEPAEPITAAAVDDLTRKCDLALSNVLGRATSIILVSRHGRVLGDSDPRPRHA